MIFISKPRSLFPPGYTPPALDRTETEWADAVRREMLRVPIVAPSPSVSPVGSPGAPSDRFERSPSLSSTEYSFFPPLDEPGLLKRLWRLLFCW